VLAPRRTELDLLDADATTAYVGEHRPERVVHLAAFASAGASWKHPRRALEENVATTLNLLDAIRAETPGALTLLASSGEIYGPPERLPVTEDAALHPRNPYAVSKAACDLLGEQFAAAHGLAIVRARAFNHAGPGQTDEYVLGTLTRQVAEAEARGEAAVVLCTGRTDTGRDFTDVRDVVRAYFSAVDADPGAYNVCSGRSVTVTELIGLVSGATELEVRQLTDPERVRPHEVEEVRGSAARLHAATGWEPEIDLAKTVRDALEHWRAGLIELPARGPSAG